MKIYYYFILIFLSSVIFAQENLSSEDVQKVAIDFNLDGIEDLVEGILSDSTFIIKFISKDTVSFSFRIGVNKNQDAFCGTKILIQKEKLDYNLNNILNTDVPGFIVSDTDYGVNLSDGMCDSFHFYWDYKLKKICYWRL